MKKALHCLCILTFLLIASFPSSTVYSEEKTFEFDYLSAMLLYCMPPIVAKNDVAVAAEAKSLPEFPQDKAILFDKSGGRVFKIPTTLGNGVLAAHKPGGCSLIAQQIDTPRFWALADRFFGPKSPFVLKDNKSETPNSQHREYRADFSGPTVLMISVHDKPVENGVQAVMTFSRLRQDNLTK